MYRNGLIGIVSGRGPLGGSDVLDKALAYASEAYGAVEDADYPDIVLFSHGMEHDASGRSMDPDDVRELAALVREIEVHHPTALGIAGTAAHLYLDELRRNTNAEIVNVVEETAADASRYDHRYLLLSSSTTRRTDLYHDALRRRGVQFLDVSDADQLDVDDIVHAVMAHELDAAGAQIDELVLRLEAEQFDGIIAAGTELPIALDHADVPDALPVIDSNRVLARSLVDTFFRIRRAGPVLVRVG